MPHGAPGSGNDGGVAGRVARAAGVLLLAGVVLRPVEAPAWRTVAAAQPGLERGTIEQAAGRGLLPGVLGGFRAVMADFLWLRANACWEDCDLADTEATLRLVTTVDPRPLGFWVNGARMIGYDMPAWRVAALGGEEAVPVAVRRRIDEEQARRALAHLERALAVHPRQPLVHVEMANLHLRRRGDPATAAACYRRAAELPGAPGFAARIHGELLRQLGREREAHAWLVGLHPTLPAHEPDARAAVVLERIRALEEKLALPPAERYRPVQQ